LETAVRIGACHGSQVDKFKTFGLTALHGWKTGAPLVKECLASFECAVEKYFADESILVVQTIAAYENEEIRDRREIHALGDGRFAIDGEITDLRHLMEGKIPEGV
jgi:flavin reductase (DIM6/NTAB) family NADH-FMN oxidoreductase RutF